MSTTHFRTCPLCEATCGLEITIDVLPGTLREFTLTAHGPAAEQAIERVRAALQPPALPGDPSR